MSDSPKQLAVEDVLDPTRFMDYESSALKSPTVGYVLRLIDRPGLRVGDIGGASGAFLQEIGRLAEHPFEGTVLEVDGYYRDRQVDPAIAFIEASILDSGLPDGSFDLLTFRHVLHHLVSDSVKGTLALQRRALAEMMRLLAPGGHLVFQEQINRVKLFSRMVYYLSLLFNRYKIRLRYFETGVVVVSFLTPKEVEKTIGAMGRESRLQVLHSSFQKRRESLRWKLTLLMAFGGDVTYVLGKPVESPESQE